VLKIEEKEIIFTDEEEFEKLMMDPFQLN